MKFLKRAIHPFTFMLAVLALKFIAPIPPAIAADEEGYERVEAGELKLEFTVKTLAFSNGGKCVAIADGAVLRINGHPLAVKGVSNCKLDTEELGPVKLLGTGSFGAQLWLTPAQKAKAKTLK